MGTKRYIDLPIVYSTCKEGEIQVEESSFTNFSENRPHAFHYLTFTMNGI